MRPPDSTPAPSRHPDTEAEQLDFPGFLRTARGLYIRHADFLAFVGRAAARSGIEGPEAARTWLRRHGFPQDITRLSPEQVSRALQLAQHTIAPQLGNAPRRSAPPR